MGLSSFFSGSGVDIVKDKLVKLSGGYDLFQLEPYKNAMLCKVPAVFAFSYEDKLIKAHHSETIMKNYGGPMEKIIFQGDHNTFRPKKYFEDIMNYLKEKL